MCSRTVMQAYHHSQHRKLQILGIQCGAQVSLPEPASPAFEAYITKCNPLGNANLLLQTLHKHQSQFLMNMHVTCTSRSELCVGYPQTNGVTPAIKQDFEQDPAAYHCAISLSFAVVFALPVFLTMNTVFGPSLSHMICALL